jgi:hypothetical protein
MFQLTEDNLRKHFWALRAREDEILKVSTPLREERDEKAGGLTPQQAADYKARILAAEKGLFDLRNEIAATARALKNKTGSKLD